MPGSVLGGGDPVVNKIDKNACPHGAYILEGESEKHISKYSVSAAIHTWQVLTKCVVKDDVSLLTLLISTLHVAVQGEQIDFMHPTNSDQLAVAVWS